MSHLRLIAGAAALLGLVGCQAAPQATLAPAPAAPATAGASPVAAPGASRSVVLTFASPKAYGVRSTTGADPVYHWQSADVYQYDVVVQVGGPGKWTTDRTIVVPRAQTVLTVDGLNGRHDYQALVTAKGNRGGTSADSVLNAVPVAVSLGGTPVTIQVTLDDVPFIGRANVTVSAPSDGAYLPPSDAPAGEVQP